MSLKVTLLVLSFVSCGFAYNILAIIPSTSYSHQIAFTAIWKELSLRGHKVTLVTADPLKDAKLTNLTEIDVQWAYKYVAGIASKLMNSESYTMWNMITVWAEITIPMAIEQLAFPPIKHLMEDTSKRFDVVIVEHLFPEFLGFAEIYKCPKILVSSLDTWENIHDFVGNPHHPIVYPEIGSPFYGQLSFKDRVVSTLYSWHTRIFFSRTNFPDKEKILHDNFNTSVSLSSLVSDIDLLILNVNPVIQNVRAVGPTTINIGGYRPSVMSSPPLPKDLQEFLDGATNGFIYFSLGSNAKSKDLGEQTLNSIITILSELPYKVLWKFEADTLPGKSENVKLVKWVPQLQVLAHHNIKLFITQGGLQSMEESIYNEVPLVVIPFFGDQDQNAALMASKGIAKIVKKSPSIDTVELKKAILEVVQKPKYKAAVQRLKRLSLDFPMTGLEKAIWWIEYVVRNNGTKHLRNPVIDLPMYQYYLLDVLGFFALLFISAVLLLIISVRALIGLFKRYTAVQVNKLKKQ